MKEPSSIIGPVDDVIIAKGSEKLIFIEVQTGSYFGEDDIVRVEDDYNRI